MLREFQQTSYVQSENGDDLIAITNYNLRRQIALWQQLICQRIYINIYMSPHATCVMKKINQIVINFITICYK